MNLRRKRPPDSLYMLLDTMCNAFGGIILLAVLVTLLTSKERDTQHEAPADARELFQRRLSLAQADLQHALELSVSLEAKANDDRRKTQIALLSTRKDLQDALDEARQQAVRSAKELDSTATADPAERLKFLDARLAEAQARKLEIQNRLDAATENTRRLKRRLEAIQSQIAKLIHDLQRPLRLPKEHETGKRSFYVIAQYGRIYPCRNSDLSRNETTIKWTTIGENWTARPIPGRGYDPVAGERELQAFFNSLPKELVFVAFCVFEDSFPQFNRAKELATSCGLAYGWDPYRNQDGPPSFGPVGHDPKAQ
jgi:hypothetical protein